MPFACNFHSNTNIYNARKKILDVVGSKGLYFWNDSCWIWRSH